MDIYSYIKKDHETVASLFEQAIAAKDNNTIMGIFLKIKEELTLHAKSEEQTFYEAIKRGNEKLQEKEEHAEHEHDEIEEYLEKLTKLVAGRTEWLVTFGEFKHCVEHHVEEEEGEIFQMAKKVISREEAIQLAADMDNVKQQMKAKMPKLVA